MSEAASLAVAGISRRFGALRAVDDVSLDVAPGQMRGLIGPNGAGKTTLFNVLTGFLAPTAGTVRLDDTDITGWRPQKVAGAGLARTFQSTKPIGDLDCLNNVAIGRYRLGRSGALGALFRSRRAVTEERMAEARALELLDWLGIGELASLFPHQLSAGQRRLLELARALATEPRVLLMDEPAAGLTQDETATLEICLGQLKDSGLTCVLVEHDVNLVLRACDRVTVVNFGRVIAEGTPDEVTANPEVLEAYLGKHATVGSGD